MQNTSLVIRPFLFIFFSLVITTLATAQDPQKDDKKHLIQFSGLVVTNMDGNIVPVPYASVFLPEKKRGTYADYRGFFTIVVERGDVIRFNCIGFDPVTKTVPDTLTQNRYSIVQILAQDTLTISEVVIFPWPSKEHFKIEFLKMDVTPELQRIAAANVANEYMAEARKNPDIVPYGGRESANFYLRQQAREYVYIGQTPPMNIFSPLAWAQFIKAWKNGDFKKK
ncbi:MAG: carboxypeptidase-like regulatory domain-containing protein [Bacteroidetes bacterium]|nr:MAG: carboxypeptidase-like regulatory domain-containing protein [Bacteroidota bacterium]